MKKIVILYIHILCLISLIVGACRGHFSTDKEKSDNNMPPISPIATQESSSHQPRPYMGTVYYFVRGDSPSTSGVWRMNLANRQKVQVHEGWFSGVDAELSLDGRWLAYMSGKTDEQGKSLETLWLLNLTTGEVSQPTPYMPLVGWRWLPNGQLNYTLFPEYTQDELGLNPPDYGANIKNFYYDPVTNVRIEVPYSPPYLQDPEGEVCDIDPSPIDLTLVARTCLSISGERDQYLEIIHLNDDRHIMIAARFNGSSVWAPDGQALLFSNDDRAQSRELFIWESPTGDTRQITHTTEAYSFFDLTWSLDEKWAAFHEQDGRVCFVDLATGEINCVSGYRFPIGYKMSWSPDSRAFIIAAVKEGEPDPEGNDMYIISVPDGDVTRLTEDPSQFEYNPIWVR